MSPSYSRSMSSNRRPLKYIYILVSFQCFLNRLIIRHYEFFVYYFNDVRCKIIKIQLSYVYVEVWIIIVCSIIHKLGVILFFSFEGCTNINWIGHTNLKVRDWVLLNITRTLLRLRLLYWRTWERKTYF